MNIVITEQQYKKILNKQSQEIDEVLKDDIPTYMSDIIKNRYRNVPDILDRDVPKHTDKIPNVKVEITDEKITNRLKGTIFKSFGTNIINEFNKTKLSENFHSSNKLIHLISVCLKDTTMSILSQGERLNSFDSSTIGQFINNATKLYTKEFILPTLNQDGKMVLSNNKSGIAKFLQVIKKIDPTHFGDIDVESFINDKHFVGLREPIINYHNNLNKLQSEAKLYLYITDKPDDKLRMSLSRYYDSCQNLYSGGDEGTQYNKKLLSNVFDPNSKVAYLIYNAPFTDNRGNVHPYTSMARTILRVNENGGVMFDKVYPNDMEDEFFQIIEKNTGLKNVGEHGDVYHYHGEKGLPTPYMDRYRLRNTNSSMDVLEDPRVLALHNLVNFDADSLEIISDDTFRVDGEEWTVSTYNEAIERTRDNLIENFNDLFWEISINDLIDYKIFGREGKIGNSATGGFDEFPANEPIFDLINKYGEDFNDTGLEFNNDGLKEYLNEYMGIRTFGDLSLEFNIKDSWLYRNLDMASYIDYFGGEYEAMSFALAKYDGRLEEVNNYYIYRVE